MPNPRKQERRLTFLKMAKAWKHVACQRTMSISTYNVRALAAMMATLVQRAGIRSIKSECSSWRASHQART
jgi:hypothetical protein